MTAAEITSIDMSLPIGSLEAYIHRVNNFPMLSMEEEFSLARRFQQEKDLTAARKLVLSHLKFVVKIAKNYAGYGLSHADLIQEGNVGLMKAVKRFNPELGVRLVSFAVYWIKAEIHEFVLKNWRIVKVATTKAQRKLFFNLRKLKKHLEWFSKKEVEEVAQTLNVSEKTVVQMENRLSSHDAAFDGHTEDEENCFAPANFLEDRSNNPEDLVTQSNWQEKTTSRLSTVFKQIDKRSQAILQRRWLAEKKATLQELADEYKVSAERIRQLEQQAIQKLRKLMPLESL